MRTTLTIEDDVLEAARTIAADEGTSVGEAVSRLARRGLVDGGRVREQGAEEPPAFTVPAGARAVTPEAVARALED